MTPATLAKADDHAAPGAARTTRTTIGQLVFRTLPAIDFARLAADLDAALGGCDARQIGRALEQDGVAFIDQGGSRIGLSLCRGLDRRGAAAITVTVGYGPQGDGDAALARRQSVLARLIAQRIVARFQPVETLWSESDEVATEEGFDRLRRQLVERRRVQEEAQAERLRQRPPIAREAIEPGDVQRMFHRLEAALDTRRLGRPELVPVHGMSARDWGDEPGDQPAASPPMRLAAHMIDATLMLVALPVGVAMMVYGLIRGADFNNSARVMALSGFGLSVLHLAEATALLRGMTL